MFQKVVLMLGLVALCQVGMVSTSFAKDADKADLDGAITAASTKEEMKAAVKNMSKEDRLDNSSKRVNDMKSKLAEVSQLLDETRDKEKDIRKLNCIADKAMTMKGYIKVSEESYTSLSAASNSQPEDTDAAAHHFILIAVAYNRVLTLTTDAKLCVGQQEDASEESKLDVRKDKDIVPLDPVLPGGYLGIDEVFGVILDPTKIEPLTPLQ